MDAALRRWVRRLIDRVVGGSVLKVLEDRAVIARIDALESELRAMPDDFVDALHGAGIHPRVEILKRGVVKGYPEHDEDAGERACVLMHLLKPEALVDGDYVRLGRDHDGGYVMAADLLNGGVAYSFGIADDVSWDADMAERGYEVFQYDHTIERLPDSHERFHFEAVGICPSGRDGGRLRSLYALLERNGHAARRDLVLKIDVEGAEWEVFAAMPAESLRCFAQIVVELHWLDRAGDAAFFATAHEALSRLRREFVPVHVHGNNYGGLRVLGGVCIAPVLEVTYVRRDLARTKPDDRCFPTPLDQPNHPDRPDLWLGRFEYPEPVSGGRCADPGVDGTIGR
ncbi:class I SAM-dependent methyltransferase [Pseudazoarcus pumilus]|uniref:Methyltransferase FkbM domain-containing protein n=1 Tax=Pseudazoarcus pumilus TaxID=2067960 RepID=A0A2I6S8Y0_9RHOO|nr:FkbM family methyltransferase [Pseudazoarcus pumilus]AUN95708.1 hypothetical protein C0099_12665 [Pseudazoarcus pumilus]